MKTAEELNALKEEFDALKEKLNELSTEELAQVSGGDWDEEDERRQLDYFTKIATIIEHGDAHAAKMLFSSYGCYIPANKQSQLRVAFYEKFGYPID